MLFHTQFQQIQKQNALVKERRDLRRTLNPGNRL